MKIKSNKTPIILGCLGVLAISTIGFATWMVGHENTSSKNDISVTVDTYEDKGLILECIPTASDKKINLGDQKAADQDQSNKPVTVDQDTLDLSVGLDSFKLAISDNYYRTDKIKEVAFDVKLGETALTEVTMPIGAGDVFERTEGAKTFLNFAHATIPFSEITNKQADASTIPGWKIYDLGISAFTFEYGSLYENTKELVGTKTPANFYNSNTEAYNSGATIETQKATMQKWSKAAQELKALYDTFNGKTIHINIDVTFNQ